MLLSRTIQTHHVDFPIPFPLTETDLEALRQERAAAGVSGDPLAGLDLDSVARARAVARGDHLVHSRCGCVECHGKAFGGGVMVDDPMLGRILGPNITAGEGGRTMSDIVSYIRSLPTVNDTVPPPPICVRWQQCSWRWASYLSRWT